MKSPHNLDHIESSALAGVKCILEAAESQRDVVRTALGRLETLVSSQATLGTSRCEQGLAPRSGGRFDGQWSDVMERRANLRCGVATASG